MKKKRQPQRNRKFPSKSFYHNYNWRVPVIITLLCMFVMIVILPTFIVMLPTKTASVVDKESTVFKQVDDKEEIELPSFDVQVKRTSTEEIEEVPLEQYVTSVVASEMPAEFEEEALKAQAIAARTYIVNHLLHHPDDKDSVITDETKHQVYLNEAELKQNWGNDYSWKIDKIKSAVKATENEVIVYHDQPITPTFFSMSNGYTEDAKDYWGNELPYLKSVESKWEIDNPKFKEQKILSLDEVNEKMDISLPTGQEIPIEVERTSTNRIGKLYLNKQEFTGREVREGLGLRSSDFSIKQKDNHLIFTTKGYGHGVGMSQYGANGMAKEGRTYKDIITYYYQDVEISTIKEAAPTLVSK